MRISYIILGLLLAVLISSCTTQKYLPKSSNIDENRFGSYITIYRIEDKMVKGELIAVDSIRLVVLVRTKEIPQSVIVPISEISSFKIRYARPKNYLWTIPLFTLSTVAHGIFLVITAPINLIVTTNVTVSGAFSFTYSDKKMTDDKLKMFARFPQGIPPNIDISSIR
ncbi:MAG: hypothetical protein IIA45_00570 [Bacteroidetes bacterium]|nr:hypothetical protein [Bacteroidota bacterium]